MTRPPLTDAEREYLRREIAKRRTIQACPFPEKKPVEPPPPEPEREPWHGTVNGYRNRKCRCSDCRAAQAAYMRVYSRRAAIRKRGERIAVELNGDVDGPSLFIAVALEADDHNDLDELIAITRLPEDDCRAYDRRMRDNGIWMDSGHWGFESIENGQATDAAGIEIAMHMLVAEGKLVRIAGPEHLEPWPEGSHLAYSKGCRCSDCKRAQRDYMRQWRAAHPTRGMAVAARNGERTT